MHAMVNMVCAQIPRPEFNYLVKIFTKKQNLAVIAKWYISKIWAVLY